MNTFGSMWRDALSLANDMAAGWRGRKSADATDTLGHSVRNAITFKSILGLSTALLLSTTIGISDAQAASAKGAFLVPLNTTTTPPGAARLCSKYRWACTNTQSGRMGANAALAMADAINRQVNRQVREVEDQAQYRTEEYWALPTRRGGDCEDFALLKMKKLLEQGMASKDLMIATVLDTKRRSHAVLVLRTSKGDFVLDNMRTRILSWGKTGYTFLKMQSPNSPGRWDAILAGGIMSDQSTASSKTSR